MKYFYINNTKFCYDLEFKNNSHTNFWKQNTPLIEYCETLGINIPHYCYHKNLSISGNCRMCLVELKNSPKPIVSCAMNAKSCLANGDVFTNSTLVKKARENILEFLLLNHPLDCPICDQGGECDLQDQSLFFGLTKKRFYGFKRVVIDKNIGPIVKTVMTRCIHCTRCVRFATEIAGIEDMGMFGRGIQSEIGTYIEKVFQSELSGNVIDLCPVGALTSKPYPFIGRSWELKSLVSIDFSDGFGTPIQLFVKNNQITKVLPGYEKTTLKTNWISDKTRFSFDGMFSPKRLIYNFIDTNSEKSLTAISWKKLFKEFFYTLYFQDHLLKHMYQPNQITICLTKNLNIETLSLLSLLTNKYSFFKIRQPENHNVNLDFESNYLLNSSLNELNLLISKVCLLIGVNSRYEGSKLNLKLKARFSKGNFKVISLNSMVDLTFKSVNVSNNLKTLKSLVEGNNLLCQEFVNTSNPILISNSNIFKRNDSLGVNSMLMFMIECINAYSQSNNPNLLNILNLTLNEAGAANYSNFKTLTTADFKRSTSVYFINNSFSNSNIKKLLNLKLLNYFYNYKNNNKLLVTQGNNIEEKLITQLKKNYNFQTHIHLPNEVFFETSGTYINTEGTKNKIFKTVKSLGQGKSDWQIIRKILAYSEKMLFINNFINKNKIIYNCINNKQYSNYVGFHHYPILNITSSSFQLLEKTIPYSFPMSKFNLKRKKLFKSQFRLWLNDFYFNEKDNTSKFSSVMIRCSKLLRTNNTNFKF